MPAFSESCAHQGAKHAAHSDTVLWTSKRHCVSHLRKILNATVGIVCPYIIPVALAL